MKRKKKGKKKGHTKKVRPWLKCSARVKSSYNSKTFQDTFYNIVIAAHNLLSRNDLIVTSDVGE